MGPARGALAQIRRSLSAEFAAYLQNGPRHRRLTSKEVYANERITLLIIS